MERNTVSLSASRDGARIQLDDPLTAAYWLERYHMTLEELQATIQLVGSAMVAEVEKYICRHPNREFTAPSSPRFV
ncbi:DUF3606 domain-containing protein [Thermoflavifilum thermophilum]|uniref:DUF3606 domain-containing protein n=1 Tax=Thermoflavifilum thermophilum TaxID=1393122 RepID=A0A1I7NL39_9BACT|nr:DUF3606 domain-containing protein [Thermoflavifilum thermophilum]SFV35377.1 Protein of unknown function [Thermoflavifilum thermophilum]